MQKKVQISFEELIEFKKGNQKTIIQMTEQHNKEL